MSKEHNAFFDRQGMLLGLAASAIIGTAAGILLSSSKTRNALHSFYDETSEKLNEFAHPEKRRSHRTRNLAIGAVAGGIIGLSAIVLLAHESREGILEKLAYTVKTLASKAHRVTDNIEETAHGVAEGFEDRISSWAAIAQKFIDTFDKTAQQRLASRSEKSHVTSSYLDAVLDWAVHGIQLFQGLKK